MMVELEERRGSMDDHPALLRPEDPPRRQLRYSSPPLVVVLAVFACCLAAFAIVLVVTLTRGSCSTEADSGNGAGGIPPPTMRAFAADMLSSRDTSVDPCQDFYTHACGGWLRSNTIPSDRSSWGRSFSNVQKRIEGQLKGVLEANWPVLSTVYANCLNASLANSAGLQPLDPLRARIDNTDMASMDDVMRLLAILHRAGVGAFFSFDVDQDMRNADANILEVDQGGMSLPDRGYYFPDERTEGQAEARATLEQFREYVGKMARFLNLPAKETVDAVLEIETRLANASLSVVQRRDPASIYHPYKTDNLPAAMAPLRLHTYLSAVGVPAGPARTINVAVEEFFTALVDVLAMDAAQLKAYLHFKVLQSYASYLTDDVYEPVFAFFSGHLYGVDQKPERWLRCMNRISSFPLGELLGRYFVLENFSEENKKDAAAVLKNIRAEFVDSASTLDWMDKATYAALLEKATHISDKVGFPDVWKSFAGFTSAHRHPAEDRRELAEMDFDEMIATLDKGRDRTKWHMNPHQVNAYYSPQNNEIVFPAAILMPPFFSSELPAAANYGAVGSVMGHELTHAFDDSGSQYDKDGNLKEWWSDDVRKKFQEKAGCVSDLYSSYKISSGNHVNGKLTLGENLSDMGGLKLAYHAYKKSGGILAPPDVFDGLTDDQVFFLSFAQTWCTLRRPAVAELYLQTDPHSPPEHRVNGPLSQFSEFANAFQCDSDTHMSPTTRCQVW